MRVAIAEDSVLLREGLTRLLSEAGCEVVAQCGTADDLLLKVRSYTPDVAIVDIRPGNLAMYYPEANAIVPGRVDAQSRTPAFKSVAARLAKVAT